MSSTKVVLDASAILTVIRGEPGAEKLPAEMLVDSVASAVNLAEVHSKLVVKGWNVERAWEDAIGIVGEVFPFSPDHAKAAGSLVSETRKLGLSLGDRACLALAQASALPVLTADRAWKDLNLSIEVQLLR